MSLLERLLGLFGGTPREARAAGGTESARDAAWEELHNAEWLVVGLGNPGTKYAATRHNVGYMAVDNLVGELSPVPGVAADATPIPGTNAVAVRVHSYMNDSGRAVAELARRVGVTPDHVVVIHDELDLPPNRVRVKLGGNENGHNGLKSLSQHLGTRDYLRVRLGIGRPGRNGAEAMPIPDWVLGPVAADPELDAAVATAADAARLLVTKGLTAAQNDIHSR